MGRWPWSNRYTVEGCRSLSVTDMLKAGVFEKGLGNYWVSRWTNSTGEKVASISYWVQSGETGSLCLRLSHTITRHNTDEKISLDYPVELTSTPCNYGGVRYWFICPLVINNIHCERRVGKLYLPPGGKYFGCRHCYNLTYTSCRESHRFDRLFTMIANDVPGATPDMVKEILTGEW